MEKKKSESAAPRVRPAAKKSATHLRAIGATRIVDNLRPMHSAHLYSMNQSIPCMGDCCVAPNPTQTVLYMVEPMELKVKLAFIYLYVLVWVVMLYVIYKLSLWMGRILFALP